jgi:DNA-directed RNA polymerase specialized sigma24 family protein
MPMASDYDPPEEKVAALVAKHTPRQLAIAYLRAQHRFRHADLMKRTMLDAIAARNSADSGDFDGMMEDLERATMRLKRARTGQDG